MQRCLESSEIIIDDCESSIDGEIIQLVQFDELISSNFASNCTLEPRLLVADVCSFDCGGVSEDNGRNLCAWEWRKLLISRWICIKHAEGFKVFRFTPRHGRRWKNPPPRHETRDGKFAFNFITWVRKITNDCATSTSSLLSPRNLHLNSKRKNVFAGMEKFYMQICRHHLREKFMCCVCVGLKWDWCTVDKSEGKVHKLRHNWTHLIWNLEETFELPNTFDDDWKVGTLNFSTRRTSLSDCFYISQTAYLKSLDLSRTSLVLVFEIP